MSFSVAFWNVENFWGKKSRSRKVENRIRSLTKTSDPPDVIGFCEVKDKTLMRQLIMQNFEEYDFAMSDTAIIPKRGRGRKAQIEILVGWRRGIFDQAMYTQRIELTGGRTTIRPGALLNVRTDGDWYSLLFLHTKSGANTKSYGVRKKQFSQVFSLKRKLDSIDPSGRGRKARLIVVGDLNTMGNGPKGSPRKVSGAQEVRKLKSQAARNDMTMQFKEFENTFNQRHPRQLTSNLDHVLTSKPVKLKTLGKTTAGKPFTVRVEGWNQLLGDKAKLHDFEDTLSDHSALYFEVLT